MNIYFDNSQVYLTGTDAHSYPRKDCRCRVDSPQNYFGNVFYRCNNMQLLLKTVSYVKVKVKIKIYTLQEYLSMDFKISIFISELKFGNARAVSRL